MQDVSAGEESVVQRGRPLGRNAGEGLLARLDAWLHEVREGVVGGVQMVWVAGIFLVARTGLIERWAW